MALLVTSVTNQTMLMELELEAALTQCTTAFGNSVGHRASNVCSSDDIGGHFSSPLVFVRTDLTPWAKPLGYRMDDGLAGIGKCDW